MFKKHYVRGLAGLVIAGALVGCGQPARPKGMTCTSMADRQATPTLSPDEEGLEYAVPIYDPVTIRRVSVRPSPVLSPDEPSEDTPEVDGAQEDIVSTVTVSKINHAFRERMRGVFLDDNKSEISILTISAGAQWGAYGVGFLRGLEERTGGRKRYDIVTGVSTGALIAPLIFTGRDKDIGRLEEEYTQIEDRDVISKRSTFSLLYSDSLYSTTKLEKRVGEVIDDELVREIAKGTERDQNRRLAVLAINADTGQSQIFDLTAIAAGEGQYDEMPFEERRELITKIVLSSASMPIGFSPKYIDGEMFVDGGARQHVFVGSEILASSAREYESERQGPGGTEIYEIRASKGVEKPVNLYVVVNGDFRVLSDCTSNSLLGIAGRTASIVVNQLLYDSVYRLMSFADQSPNWHAYMTDARQVTRVVPQADPGELVAGKCAVPLGDPKLFNNQFMKCLYKQACIYAANSEDDPWQTQLDALPTLVLGGEPGTGEIPAACVPEDEK